MQNFYLAGAETERKMNKITKRADGRYQCIIELPTLSGTRKRKYIYGETKAECKQKALDTIQDIASGNIILDKNISVELYLKKWLDTYCKTLSPTSLDGYTRYVNRYVLPNIGHFKMCKVLPINIQTLINDFAQTHSPKSCKSLCGILHKAFNDAKRDGFVKSNPAEGIRLPKGPKYQYNIYTNEQYLELLRRTSGIIEEIPIALAGLCGMRKSEILGLTWNDIDFSTNQIKIRQSAVNVNGNVFIKEPKTESSTREITAPQYVIDLLKKYKSVGYVYPNKNGGPENGANFGKRFSNLLKKLEMPHTRFHDLRHFNATLMLTLGIPDKEAAARLGHSNINMTKKYQHVLKTRDEVNADAINSIVKNQ